MTFRATLKTEIFKGKLTCVSVVCVRQSCSKMKKKHLDSMPVSFFPSIPTGNLKLIEIYRVVKSVK